MNYAKAITKDSFKITGRGIILDLQHSENGLAKETELISEKTEKKWRVMVRILFDHAVHEQKIFENESVDYMLMRFESIEKNEKSIEGIKIKESQNIYQYIVKPVNHEDEPEKGEKLKIYYPQQKL